MGAWPSLLFQQEVDLLPPRLERHGVNDESRHDLLRLTESPFRSSFGRERIGRLLTDHYAAGAFRAHAALAPAAAAGEPRNSDSGIRLDFHASSSRDDRPGLNGADASLLLAWRDAEGGWNTGAFANATTGGTLRAAACAQHDGSGLGGYLLIGAPNSQQPTRRAGNEGGVGAGMLESPARFVALPGPPPMPSLGAAAVSAPHAEVGARFTTRDGDWSCGVHASPFAPYPTRVWAIGGYGREGSVAAGVQLTGDAAGAWQPLASTARSSGNLDGAPPQQQPPPRRLAIDAALSVARAEPCFEVAVALDGAAREVAASYVHYATVRRAVLNPLEAAHVRGIFNYVDIGLEFRRGLAPPYGAAFGVGGAWQLNKNAMLKARLGSRDAAAAVVLTTWWDPRATVAATVARDASTGAVAVGLLLAIEQGGAPPLYRKAARGAQGGAPSRALRAQPQLGARRDLSRVDPEPFRESEM